MVAASTLISVTDFADCPACLGSIAGEHALSHLLLFGPASVHPDFFKEVCPVYIDTGSWYPKVESKHLITTNMKATDL